MEPDKASGPRRATCSVVLLAGIVGISAACGGDDDSGAEAIELEDVMVMEGAAVEVTALDNSFNHQNIQVAPGTRVTWENQGRQDHDIVRVDDGGGGEEWGVDRADFAPGDVYERTFDEPGTYRYYCSLHGTADAGMIGAVVVEAPAGE